LSSC
jgi:hypothetical protein